MLSNLLLTLVVPSATSFLPTRTYLNEHLFLRVSPETNNYIYGDINDDDNSKFTELFDDNNKFLLFCPTKKKLEDLELKNTCMRIWHYLKETIYDNTHEGTLKKKIDDWAQQYNLLLIQNDEGDDGLWTDEQRKQAVTLVEKACKIMD